MTRSTAPPITPRLLDVADAAAYFSLSIAAFKRLRIGEISLGPRVLYDRHALDAYLDQASGLAPQSATPQADNDPEAAFDRSAPHLRASAGRP